MTDPLQIFWDNIFSEDPEKITQAYKTLGADEKQYVLVHLYKMINEPGWHPAQVQTAQTAIQVIEANPDKKDDS